MSSSQEKKTTTSLTLSAAVQHNALVTTQVKQALSLTKKLLSARNALVDESWMQEIWDWADEYEISESIIARDKAGLLQMTSLSAEYSNICCLPESIGNLTNLTEINLRRCDWLTELPQSIGNLTNLTRLDFSWCSNLTTLPESIGNLINLSELNLGISNITTLPESIGNLTSLTNLDLYECVNLTTLPESIGNLTSLTRLNLSWCSNLTTLPQSIGNLTNCEIYRF